MSYTLVSYAGANRPPIAQGELYATEREAISCLRQAYDEVEPGKWRARGQGQCAGYISIKPTSEGKQVVATMEFEGYITEVHGVMAGNRLYIPGRRYARALSRICSRERAEQILPYAPIARWQYYAVPGLCISVGPRRCANAQYCYWSDTVWLPVFRQV